MASKALPSSEVLRQLLDYDPGTGDLIWRVREPEWFDGGKYDSDRVALWWNTRFAGRSAFCTFDQKGYAYGVIFGRRVAKHRVVWVFHHEAISGEIDHIDGNPANNRIENLRDVTRQTNMKNKRMYAVNSSGFRGVYWSKPMRKWRVAISEDGHERHLGFFASFDDAVTARKAAEQAHGFHENHGRNS